MNFFRIDNRLLFYATLAILVLPVWIADYPPLVDLPQHMAQVNALGLLLGGDPTFTEVFEINWFTPYFLPYVALFLLDTVLPIMIATKLLLSLGIIALPVVTGQLLREIGGDERLRWLSIPSAFSFALYWGFLSFLVTVPIGIWLVCLTVRFSRSPSAKLAAAIVATGIVLFFSHVLVLGISAAVSLAYLLGSHWKTPVHLVRLALPYAAPLPLIVYWLTHTTTNEAYVQNADVYFGNWSDRWIELLTAATGIDLVVPTATVAAGLLFYTLPGILGCRLTRNPARWLAALCAFIVFLGFPAVAFNTHYLYVRFGIFLLPAWLLLWDKPPGKQLRFQALPVVLVAAVATINLLRFEAFNSEARNFAAVAQQVPERARILAVGHGFATSKFRAPVYQHFGAFQQALNDGIADFNFGFFYPQLVRYQADSLPPFDDSFTTRPLILDWQQYGGDNYDYFLLFEQFDMSPIFFRGNTSAVEFVDRRGRWWLYRNVERTSQASAVSELRQSRQ